MKILGDYLKIRFKSQTIYRTSFILLCVGQFFVPFFVFIGLKLLFLRFNQIGTFTFDRVALLYGTIHTAFALAECFGRGFDSFANLVKSGEFDRLMVRPQPLFLQVLGSRFEFTRIGRLVQGLAVLALAIEASAVQWTILKGITVVLMVFGGAFVFVGVMILFATTSFWVVEHLEIANLFTDGGREMAQYPISIYWDKVRQFFTFVIPFSLVNYLPLNFIYEVPSYTHLIYAFIPVVAMGFIFPCMGLWYFGVKHYKSTGS